MIVLFLNMLTNLISTKIPHFTLDTAVFNNASASIATIVDFLNQVNFIIPLSDIALILAIDVGIRVFKFSLFWVNYFINKVLEVL